MNITIDITISMIVIILIIIISMLILILKIMPILRKSELIIRSSKSSSNHVHIYIKIVIHNAGSSVFAEVLGKSLICYLLKN